MLRYFYILVCISLCFCYEYIEENQQFGKQRNDREIKKPKRDRSKTVQFDVMSFLRNSSGNKKSKDYEPFASKNKNLDDRTESDYYESSLNENIEKTNENTNYFNIDSDPNLIKDDTFDSNSQASGEITKTESELGPHHAIKVRNEQNKWPADKDLIQNPEKKCAFRNMRVPFFSRKASTPKKQKKKLFCTNCSKNYTTKTTKLTTKRSYGYLCPKCIKKLFKRREKEPEKLKQIHCSREFYQNVGTTQKKYKNDKRLIGNTKHLEDYSNSLNERMKRTYNDERERQLKELADVERKVDHVRVSTPKFNVVRVNMVNE